VALNASGSSAPLIVTFRLFGGMPFQDRLARLTIKRIELIPNYETVFILVEFLFQIGSPQSGEECYEKVRLLGALASDQEGPKKDAFRRACSQKRKKIAKLLIEIDPANPPRVDV
jgi:hypothetical protein